MKTPELISTLVANAGPVRPVSPRLLALASGLLAAAIVLALDVLLFHATPRLTYLAVAWSALLMAAAARAIYGALPGQRAPRAVNGTVALAAGAVLLLHAWPLLGDPYGWDWDSGVSRSGLVCTVALSALILIPVAVFGYCLRRLAPTEPTAAARRLGVAAAAAAALGLCPICGNGSPLHALLWHGLPLAALIGIVTLVGRRWLRW